MVLSEVEADAQNVVRRDNRHAMAVLVHSPIVLVKEISYVREEVPGKDINI